MSRTIRIGLLGCGVVGSGVVAALQQNGSWISERDEVEFHIARIVVRDLQKQRAPSVQREVLCTDWREVCQAPDIEVVVEVMGGIHPAYEAVISALTHGKHVVTANKELLALHGDELHRVAMTNNRTLIYEASVLGGVPILHGLETYFRANRITRIRGIVNGTCNYILTRMEEAGVQFSEALTEAQDLGYAEADPTLDVESYDALFKLHILTRFALSVQVDSQQVERIGVSGVDACDIELARQIGCRVQQVATAEVAGPHIQASVGPTFVPLHDPLSRIRGVENGLCVDGDIVGRVVFSGPGAGAAPTASAVIEDLIKIAIVEPRMARQVHRQEVKQTTPQAYFVRRRCERPREWLGPLATGSVSDTEIRIGGYVRTPDGTAEGWVFMATRESMHQVVQLFEQFDGSPIAWYPFSDLPRPYSGAQRPRASPLPASV
jgi:homoserine dehydrogenase